MRPERDQRLPLALREGGGGREARELAESVRNERLGIGEAYEKKREEKKREIREKEFELWQLQREIERGDRRKTAIDADGEEVKSWRNKRRELKALKEMKSKQLEVE